MHPITYEDIIPIETFLDYNNEEIQQFCITHDIRTCYLPVDGTRRHFILFSSSVNDWEEKHLDSYYHHVNEKFREIIRQFYDYGIKNLIILLMDESAFSRGKAFLSETIKNGIKPMYEDQEYLDLYEKYNIDVQFAGFTSVFEEYYDKNILIELETHFKALNRESAERTLVVYTGLSPSKDYLLLENYSQNLRKENIEVNRENLVKKIYGTDLSTIDFTIWFSYPRDKIIPPLLWENGTNIYIKNPTLTLNSKQIKRAIYYTALTKRSIKDKYFYHKFTEQEKLTIQNEILSSDSIMGPEYYY